MSFTPYPKKGRRIEDQKLLDWIVRERDGTCLYGLYNGDPCQFGLDPHHIVKRSAGGNDVPENVITLCRKHHDMAEANLITVEELRAILDYFTGGFICQNGRCPAK